MSAEKPTNPVPEEQIDVKKADHTKPIHETVEAAAAGSSDEKTTLTDEKTAAPEAETALPEEEVIPAGEETAAADGSSEMDSGEEDADTDVKDEEAGTNSADYSGMSKEELVSAFEKLLGEKPVQSIRRDAEQIKIAFYKIYRAEVEQLKRAFTESGGNVEEFTAPEDEQENRLKELLAEYRTKRSDYLSNAESEKENNLKVKLQIIEELKELVNSSETMNHTFNNFRDLQARWKETGPVPQTNLKDVWETYHLHVENFYNFIKINKELRDLDLRKNYEAKLQLAEEAEALIFEPSVVAAFHKLQKLHDEWREAGPVAKEYKEQLWERFREASSKINKRHQEYFENIKEDQKRNLDLKTELCVKTEELSERPYTNRKEWNSASDELIEIQKVWKTIGFAPKKDNSKVYERFRNACDKFFEAKKEFYAQAKTEMDDNLALKIEICEQAEALKESEDWKKTTDELIALQKKWKETGPVSRKHSDAVWKRFRSACDYFFEKKSTHFSDVDEQYGDNLKQKQEIIDELKEVVAKGSEFTFDQVKEIQRRWSAIGFVPVKQKDSIQSEYRRLVDDVFSKLRGGERERKIERFKGKVSGMKEEGNDRRVRGERDRLYNKLKQLEADIAVLENNIGFFSKSKNAESMIKDVNDKIEKMKEEMGVLTEKINVIDNQG